MESNIRVCHTQTLEWARQYRTSTTNSVLDTVSFLGFFVIKHFKNLLCLSSCRRPVMGQRWRPALTNEPRTLGSSLPCHSMWRWTHTHTHTHISGNIVIMPLSKSFEVRHNLVWHKNVGAYRWHTLTLTASHHTSCELQCKAICSELSTHFWWKKHQFLLCARKLLYYTDIKCLSLNLKNRQRYHSIALKHQVYYQLSTA